MSYATTTIGAILDRINISHFLPAIQRPFVWKQEQTVALFDSLLKGYPIGTFMFWELEEETKAQVRIYRFIENYSGEEAMNEPAQTEGRKVVLVLDGQQRLTSLLVGLRGTYAAKRKHTHKANPDNWERQTLYIDLLKDPDQSEDEGDDDAETGVTFGLKFHNLPPRSNHSHLWLKLATILSYPTADDLRRLEAKVLEPLRDPTPRERDLVLSTLRRLHAVVWGEELVNFFTERSQDPDRVLDIFVRSNSSGSPLKKPDFLMSMITSRWEHGAAREEVGLFARHLERDLPLPNKVGNEFLMKACLTLCDFDVKFNVRNFTGEAVRVIEKNWPAIKVALENTFHLINRFGIGEDNLTSRNAVLPLAYYIFRTPDFSFRGTTQFEGTNARWMQQWLLQSLLVGAFAGGSDRTLSRARATIRDSLKTDRNFPMSDLFEALAGNGRIARLDERGIEEVLSFEYGRSKTFLALSLLHPGIDMGSTVYHVDHIIPQADANRRVLMGQMLQEGRIKQIAATVNRLGNLQLLSAQENIEKNDIPFASWIESRDREFLDQHFIPDRPDLWRASKLPEFVVERERLLRAELMRICGL